MAKETKVKFINKKGQWVEETCHDVLTCREHKEALSRTRKITQANPEILMMDEDEIETVNDIMSTMEQGNNFSDIKDIYTDHQDLFERQGFEILDWESFGSFQGDHAAIVKKDGKVGFIVVGYGSCSGCDALQALEPYDMYEPVHSEYDFEDEDDDNLYTEKLAQYKEHLKKYQHDLQEYADELTSNVQYGTYEELKARITGADNRIKWYSKDKGFEQRKNALISALHKAFN